MMGRTHIVIGAASWIAVSHLAHMKMELLGIPVSAISSLLPDIDHPTSIVGKRIYPLSAIIAGIFGHRGITHSLLAVIAIIVTMSYYQLPMVWAVSVGYLSHLMADWCTPFGIPLMYPSKQKFASPYPVRTGGHVETAIFLGLIATIALYFFGRIST